MTLRYCLRLAAVLLLLSQGLGVAAELWSTPEGRAQVFEAFVDLFRDQYWSVDYLDWDDWAERHRDDALAADDRAAFDQVFRRMVFELDDDHSSWLGLPVESDARGDAGALAQPRLGARLGFVLDVGLVVRRVLPGSPAEAVALQRGDVIVEIDGEDVRGSRSLGGGLQLLGRQARDGALSLQILRRGAPLRLEAAPEPLTDTEVESRPQATMLDNHTGYLYVPTFRGDLVAADSHRLLQELEAQGARSLVLDLRGNLGGRLSQVGLLLGAFLEGAWTEAESRGEVAWRGRYLRDGGVGVSLLEEDGGQVLSRTSLEAPVRFDGPLVVLVDSRNSSAGEVIALALQDLGRAAVVGQPTSGNVEALRTFDLPDGSRVMVAVANLNGINGLVFSEGVQPEVIAAEDLRQLARGFDAPVAEAVRLLNGLPFTPGKFF